MINKKSWQEFVDTGLFWWINMLLHTFGWAIVREINEKNEIQCVYPAKVRFRGFDENTNSDGYKKVTNYMKENIGEISLVFEENK